MAKKKDIRMVVKMQSTESPHMYYTEKNRRNNPQRIELRKFDPIVRKHVLFKESK
jgi:large subunit ribosomal protein L33